MNTHSDRTLPKKFSINSNNCTSTVELSSHTDTCCKGPNMIFLFLEDYTVYIKPFSDECKAMSSIKVGKIETVYIHPASAEAFILVFKQALIFGVKISNSLLTPNKMEAHGVTISNAPKQIDRDSNHTIIANINGGDELITLPLRLKGAIYYLDTEHPGDERENFRRITLTSNSIWNPYFDPFQEQESRVTSSVTCQNSVDQYMLSDLMQISLKDASDTEKL